MLIHLFRDKLQKIEASDIKQSELSVAFWCWAFMVGSEESQAEVVSQSSHRDKVREIIMCRLYNGNILRR